MIWMFIIGMFAGIAMTILCMCVGLWLKEVSGDGYEDETAARVRQARAGEDHDVAGSGAGSDPRELSEQRADDGADDARRVPRFDDYR